MSKDNVDPVEATMQWHMFGLATQLADLTKHPVGLVQADMMDAVPVVARYIGELAVKKGYPPGEPGEQHPEALFILLVALSLGTGTYKMVRDHHAASMTEPLTPREEVNNFLRDLGFS